MDYLQKPSYHFKPNKGWINDPNGLVYYKGMYHIFYQHCPDFEVPGKQPMHWGHAVTKDFMKWTELPIALAPDMKYDQGGTWSGTAIVKDDRLYLVYTSVVRNENHSPFWLQTISIAYSDDGIHFEKYEHNPVIQTVPSDGSVENFRDPAVTCIDGVYYCVIAGGHEASAAARLFLYKSGDLFRWEYVGIMAEWADSLYAECPSFAQAGDQFLLTASVVTRTRGHYFSLMFGTFQDGKFTIQHSAEAYKGPDQYAGQMFRDYRGRNIMISWISGWEYERFAEKDIGCMSTPCEIQLRDGKISVYPIEEVRHLLKNSDPSVKMTEDGFVIDREGREPVRYVGIVNDLKIMRDGYITEVFVNGGEEVFVAVL